TEPDPSSILGTLNANGQVFLINPNGILFGKGAQVNVGGLVASTLGLSDKDFMAGRYTFSGDSSAAVLNKGTLSADGGYVA
ncbi:filamentous hemagglutinin, partial [Pseudomonas sp. FW305-130]